MTLRNDGPPTYFVYWFKNRFDKLLFPCASVPFILAERINENASLCGFLAR